ncbi:MAG: hypothetical protein K9N06_01875 [Candidatus Cloacimonetes bacterium]|nr:hypothetical protein [Candidatus Cloacimonadota bacterium]
MKTEMTRFIFGVTVLLAVLFSGCDHRDESNFQITSLSVNPGIIYADSLDITYAEVTVTVEDKDGYPAAGIAVFFETDIGYIWNKEYTNAEGKIITEFFDRGQSGVAHIFAYIENCYDEGRHENLIIYPYPYYQMTSIAAIPETIHADNGITQSEITVQVKDQDGFAATGVSVNFGSDLGLIDSPILTDSLGFASSMFRDTGIVGSAEIHAAIGISDTTIFVNIIPVLPVLELNLDLPASSVGVDNVLMILAFAENINGAVPDGTPVIFSTELGYFQESMTDETFWGKTVTLTTINGIARAFFNSGTLAGENTITAQIDADGAGTLLTDSEDITILPGNPSQINLIPRNSDGEFQNEIPASGTEILLIWAYLSDNFGNAAGSGYTVTFATTLGNIMNQVLTADDGIAIATFTGGIYPGIAEITATLGSIIDTTYVTITSDQVDHMMFADPEPIFLYAGETQATEITVNLFDMYGNFIDYPMEVWFRFLERPEGCNINQEVYSLLDSTSTFSENGTAIVSLYSGTTTGEIGIEAWCRPQPGQMISAVNYNIAVLPGVPANIDLDIGGMDSGEDLGGGVWRVDVSAYITDAWNNPIVDNLAVFCSLSDNPEYASISGLGYVGNENSNGEIVPGTAFCGLVYDGAFTNETITLHADIVGPLEAEEELTLPLQYGEITMTCVPAHLDWLEENSNIEILFTQCRVNVRDGQNAPVNKQRIIFTTSLGFPTDDGTHGIHPVEDDIEPYLLELYDFTGLNAEIPTDHTDGYTGPYDGDMGRLYKDAGYHKDECPPPVPAPPGMTTGTITATISGTTTSSIQTMTLFRYYD